MGGGNLKLLPVRDVVGKPTLNLMGTFLQIVKIGKNQDPLLGVKGES